MLKSLLFLSLFLGSSIALSITCPGDARGSKYHGPLIGTDGDSCESILAGMFSYDLERIMGKIAGEKCQKISGKGINCKYFDDFEAAKKAAPIIREANKRAIAELDKFEEEFMKDPRLSTKIKARMRGAWLRSYRAPLNSPNLIFVGTSNFSLKVQSFLERLPENRQKRRAYLVPLKQIESGEILSENDILTKFPELIEKDFWVNGNPIAATDEQSSESAK